MSLQGGEVPYQWRKANITAILRGEAGRTLEISDELVYRQLFVEC